MIQTTEIQKSFQNKLKEPKTYLKFKSSGLSKFGHFFQYLNYVHYRKKGKRYWDFISASIMFLVVLPLFLFLGILIKLDSKGPVFYKQKRIGKKGKVFSVFKFRTMENNSEHLSATTNKNDSRITRVGKIIRPISLDEFPQIINIIKGDMSFIGPRPLSEQEFNMVKSSKLLSNELMEDLVPRTKPGILGWAIFHGRENISYENRSTLNREYEKKCSLLFDSYISFLTMKKYWFSYLIVFSLLLLMPIIALYSI